MDIDIEHTMPVTIPTAEYLASARPSLDEIYLPRQSLGKPVRISSRRRTFTKDELEKTFEKGERSVSTSSQKGKFLKDPNAPPDTGYFVLLTISLFGLVHNLPFIFFFTANEYWMYKFRDTASNSTDANDRTSMQKYFTSLNMLTLTTPGIICNFIAAVGGHKIKATTRVLSVLAIHSAISIFNTVMVTINTDEWQLTFFIMVMCSQLVMSCATSLGGSGSMGVIAKLPTNYMGAKLMGEGAASVFSASLRLLSIFVTPSTSGAALMYFSIGSAMMIVTTCVFWLATRTKFFRYYCSGAEKDVKEEIRKSSDIIEVLRIIWPLILLIVVGLIPFSSISSLVVSQYNGVKSTVWGDKYFVTICTYFIPAVFGLIGRGIFNGFDPDLSIPTLYVLSITREVLYACSMLFSNAKPRSHLPVLLNKDWEYGLAMCLQAMTTGFTTNLITIKLIRMVPQNRIELSMMVLYFCMSVIAACTSPLGVVLVSLL